ncbi:MAG: HD-GYP domain-containing protein [Clostridia bacterium]|nr:HD-GYP domain-containing protein [Clostridia bacterium]
MKNDNKDTLKKKKKKVHGSLNINLSKSEFMNNNEAKSNRLFCKICLFAGFLVLFCLVLNEVGVFRIAPVIMRISCLASAILFFIPFVVSYVLKRNGDWVKYFMIIDILIVVIMLYSLLSYHVMMLWLFPLVSSIIYFDKKLVHFAIFTTIPAILLGHYLACTFLLLGDDPLRTVQAAMLYGALPRVILFLSIAFIARQVTKKASKMLTNAIENSNEIGRMTSGIQLVMSQNQKLMGTRDIRILAGRLVKNLGDLLVLMLKLENRPVGTVGVLDGDKFYTVDSNGNPNNICRDLGDDIGFEFNNARFKLSKQINDATSYAEEREGFVNIRFYDHGKLTGFAIFRQDVESDDYSMKEVLNIYTYSTTSIINNTMLTFDMFRTQEQLAYSLAVVSENSSQETGQHIRRVSEYARVMGKYICANDEQLETFRIAAMLHDIGKLMIPKEIIEKPGRLTAEEFGVMKKHVIYGRDIIGNAPGEVMEMARHIILHHHERWDGTGYLGVSGEDINKFARYVSVCDVFDALLSRRSYKPAWSAQKVYEEITSQSGRQFDPSAVEAFKKCYVDMLKIRDQFPDDENDEENIITANSETIVTAETDKSTEEAQKKKALPKINVDPAIVTPISI